MTRQVVITEKASQARDPCARPSGPATEPSSPRRKGICVSRPVRARGREPGSMEALVDGIAETRRALRHQAGDGRQQGGEAEGDPRGAEDGGPGLARHRLRPRGAADRPGTHPRALPLPGAMRCGCCSRRRIRRPSARRSGAPGPTPSTPGSTRRRWRAGRRTRSTAEPVADPDGDGDARPGRRRRDRHRPGQDADPGDRVPARDRDPRLRAGGVFRGRGRAAEAEGGAFRMRHAPKERILEREAAQAVLAATPRGIRGPAFHRGTCRAPTSWDRRQRPPRLHDLPSLQKSLCSATLRLVGFIEDAGSGPGAL